MLCLEGWDSWVGAEMRALWGGRDFMFWFDLLLFVYIIGYYIVKQEKKKQSGNRYILKFPGTKQS